MWAGQVSVLRLSPGHPGRQNTWTLGLSNVPITWAPFRSFSETNSGLCTQRNEVFSSGVPAQKALENPGTSETVQIAEGLLVRSGVSWLRPGDNQGVTSQPFCTHGKPPVGSVCGSPLPPPLYREEMWLLWWCVPAQLSTSQVRAGWHLAVKTEIFYS